jgi:hypothetical protein
VKRIEQAFSLDVLRYVIEQSQGYSPAGIKTLVKYHLYSTAASYQW